MRTTTEHTILLAHCQGHAYDRDCDPVRKPGDAGRCGWLLFTIAVYALPFFAGTTAGLTVFHGGSGIIGALVVAVLVSGATLTIGQIVFATVRTPLIRAVIGLLYAVPATFAGYHATLGLAHIGAPSEAWREAFAVIGAVLVGHAAWARMKLFVPPHVERRVEGRPESFPLAAATRDG